MPEEAAAPEEAAESETVDTSLIRDALAGSVRDAMDRYDAGMEAVSAWPSENGRKVTKSMGKVPTARMRSGPNRRSTTRAKNTTRTRGKRLSNKIATRP